MSINALPSTNSRVAISPQGAMASAKVSPKPAETEDRVTISNYTESGKPITGEAILPITASVGIPALATVLLSPALGLAAAGAAAIVAGFAMGGMNATGHVEGDGFTLGAVLSGGAAGLGLAAATVAGLPGVAVAATLAAGLGLYIEKNA